MRRFCIEKLLFAFVIGLTADAGELEVARQAYDHRDYATAFREYQILAREGVVEAQRKLGDLHRDGKGTPADDSEALRWYRLAAAKGDLKARFQIVDLCSDRWADLEPSCRAVDKDSEYAQIYGGIRTFAQDGDAEAQFILSRVLNYRSIEARSIEAHRYVDKDKGLSAEEREANKWLRAAMKRGDVHARVALVLDCALMGSFNAKPADWDLSEAECREMRDSLATNIDDLGLKDQLAVGYSYLVGVDRESTRAIVFIEKAAERGSTRAQAELGRLFYDGSEVPKDDSKSARWYRRFVDSQKVITWSSFIPVRQAWERLGYLHSVGAGVPLDDSEAARCFQHAAGMGSQYGQRSLAHRYRLGQGVQKDLKEAARWYRRAADQGDAESQFYLGMQLYVGIGIPQDYVQAHMWLNLAAANGNAKAAGSRDGVAKHMSPEQISQAQSLASNWHSKPDPADLTAPQSVQ